MILETYGIIKSIFPFIKEIFLWRDGAEVGKPITKKDLTRRKVATYVMAVSLFFNYILVHKTIDLGLAIVDIRRKDTALEQEVAALKQKEITTIPEPKVKDDTVISMSTSHRNKDAVK